MIICRSAKSLFPNGRCVMPVLTQKIDATGGDVLINLYPHTVGSTSRNDAIACGLCAVGDGGENILALQRRIFVTHIEF